MEYYRIEQQTAEGVIGTEFGHSKSLKDKTVDEIDRIETDIQKKEAELAALRDSLKKCKKALKALE